MMDENDNQINSLLEKLDVLSKRQENLSKEIMELRYEIRWLQTSGAKEQISEKPEPIIIPPIPSKLPEQEIVTPIYQAYQESKIQTTPLSLPPKPPRGKSDYEK